MVGVCSVCNIWCVFVLSVCDVSAECVSISGDAGGVRTSAG